MVEVVFTNFQNSDLRRIVDLHRVAVNTIYPYFVIVGNLLFQLSFRKLNGKRNEQQ